MTRFRLGVLVPVTALLSALPSVAFAKAGFFGPILPQSGSCHCGNLPLDWGCVLQVLQNLIEFAVSMGVILCVIWIAYAGFSLMVSGGSSEARTMAKNRLGNAMLGIIVILCSWLIVDLVMKTLYNPDALFTQGRFGPWNNILASDGESYCIQPHTPIAISAGSILTGLIPGGGSSGDSGGSGGSSAGGGSCSVPSSGACSTAVLSTTCFGNRVQDAARVCNLESAGGNPSIPSGSDKLDSGHGQSYSIGLWQINLTTAPLKVGGQSCTAAFTGSCGSGNGSLIGPSHPGWCKQSIKPGMQDLYNKCVAAAKNPQINSQVACTLYKGGTFQPWSFSANKCGVPLKS